MLMRRVIPCLDVHAGRVVKGVQFQSLRDAGDPVELAGLYADQGADELVLLDVSATPEGREHAVPTVRAVVSRPALLGEMAHEFGRQCTVLALDAAREGDGWRVVVRSGRDKLELDVVDWAQAAVDAGAGEILLTSWDRDGTGAGYDLELLRAVCGAVGVPVIASGGADTAEHMAQALLAGADAVLAASILHDGHTTVSAIKRRLSKLGMEVRL
jgi:imidazoleglycerol phosphate synthase cyclase subunit